MAEASNLAGYERAGPLLLDRMTELQLADMLPSTVLERLEQNLIDNTERTRGMIDESVAIQRSFQDADLSYAVLKAFSLYPLETTDESACTTWCVHARFFPLVSALSGYVLRSPRTIPRC